MRAITPQELVFVLTDLRAAGVPAKDLRWATQTRGLEPGDAGQGAALKQFDDALAAYGSALPDAKLPALGMPAEDGPAAGARIRAFAFACLRQDSSTFDALVERGALAPDDASVQLLKWRTPSHEIQGTGAVVARVLQAHPQLRPGDVFVAVPNRSWGVGVKRALEAGELKATIALDEDPFAGDPRNGRRSELLLAFARAHLLADPGDALAWRVWCGLGFPDLQAGAWRAFEQSARERGFGTADALRDASCDAGLAPDLAARAREGCAFIGAYANVRGYSLLRACMPEDVNRLAELAEPIDSQMSAADLAGRLRQSAIDAQFDPDPGYVRVGGFRQLLRENPKVVVVTGAAEGFLPVCAGHDGDSAAVAPCYAASDPRAFFCSAVARAQELLLLSMPQKAPVELARRYGLEVKRTKVESGQTLAMLAPSPFIADAGNAAPFSQSGEQYV